MKKTKLKIKYDDEFAKFHARRCMEAIEAKRKCIQENEQAHTGAQDTIGRQQWRRQHSTNHNHYTAEFIGCWCFPSLSLAGERWRTHLFTSRAQKYYFLKLLGEHFD